MTLDELLAAAGLTADFLEAMRRRDVVRLQEVLTAVRLDPATMETRDRAAIPGWRLAGGDIDRLRRARKDAMNDWREKEA